ncbi:MAG: DMT family protein [Cytophagales bacterium]|nr:DMT family protein [Cytophagales bacterium]MDW8384290.1 DMT family protein [Flammeovirgaceae bacterium]
MRAVVILMLIFSNIFMTYAWYGHLKDFKQKALWTVILISWGVAFFEYIIQVPANRIGSQYFTFTQLKTIQEVISLSVFVLFSVFYLKEPFQWNYVLGFLLICLGAYIVFMR